jgi:hypothetical protein
VSLGGGAYPVGDSGTPGTHNCERMCAVRYKDVVSKCKRTCIEMSDIVTEVEGTKT